MANRFDMVDSSDSPNFLSIPKVRMVRNDYGAEGSYHSNMAKKPTPVAPAAPDWFLREWMKYFRITQAEMMRRTDWSKATMNDIYHGRTNYYREIVNVAASALGVASWELLMPPEEAHRIRRWRAAFEAEQVKLASDGPKPQLSEVPKEERKQRAG